MTSNTHETNSLMKITQKALLAGVLALGACTETAVPDYNNPAESNFTELRTRAQLESQAVGLADADRRSHDFQILLDETMGRDFYRFDGAEPRYITQTLRGNLPSNTNFIGGGLFAGPYRTIRSAEFFIQAVKGAPDSLPESLGGAYSKLGDQTKSALVGYAQTWKALSYIRLIEQRDTIGIALFAGKDSLDPIRCKPNVLAYISSLLDSAATSLAAGDTAVFPFRLPSGFNGFNDAKNFRKFAEALKARNEVYRAFQSYATAGTGGAIVRTRASIDQNALNAAQAALNASFMDLSQNVAANGGTGVYHTYAAGGDYLNPNFDPSVYRINPRVVTESEGITKRLVGTDTIYSSPDTRLTRKVELNASDNCLSRSSARSCFLDKTNATNITPLPIIRNDELILLQAEVFWGKGQFAQALAIVNKLRSDALGTSYTPLALPFATEPQQLDLLREILRQKRYQLLLESPSRWIDARMFGLLGELGEERRQAGDDGIFGTADDVPGFTADKVPVFPIPLAERLARGGNLTKTCS